MKSNAEPPGGYAFGRFRLSADGTLLLRDGGHVALAPKVLKTLLVLVERAGQVVRKTDLLEAVWPDSFVEDTGLTRNISILRQALGDDTQTVIVTVARIGYRFTAPVAIVDRGPAPKSMEEQSAESAGGADQSEERRHPRGITLRRGGDDNDGATGSVGGVGQSRRPGGLKRLLILPFRLLRDDPDTGFLAFSVPDAVTTALSGLDSLIMRSSAIAARFCAQPVDLRKIAAEADVDAVVTGTLVRSGNEIRVTAQLADVCSGAVLWSQSLRVALGEVFELQDRLVEQIVQSLALSLSVRERRRLDSDVPGNASAYEFFLRGNEAVGPQGIVSATSLRVARALYSRAIEEDPRFAPAWARLGRCHYLIGKADDNRHQNVARAESCFQKALEISPDLALAHNLYALLEIDQGRARDAMVRLVSRGLAGSAQPELFAALVQACRFCGLLEASVAAHDRARELDATIATGGYQSLWQLGEEERALGEGIRPYLLRCLITGMRGDRGRAIEMLRDLEAQGPTRFLHCLVTSLRAVFEENPVAAFENAEVIFETCPDPEAVYLVGRNIAYFGDRRVFTAFARALDAGFVLYRVLLREDPWLDPLRSTREFHYLLDRSRASYQQCLDAYSEAGGERLLGHVPGPEELERVT